MDIAVRRRVPGHRGDFLSISGIRSLCPSAGRDPLDQTLGELIAQIGFVLII